MAKEMLINVSAGEECRIALLEDGRLEELYMERTSNTSHVGNIYKGKVTNVEPSIQAAFVDFGIGRNGFLHISDLMPTYFGRRGENAPAEKVGQKLGRRDRPPIQQCLRKGDEIVVQIIKEGIGTKGPTLSTYLSVPGRVLVMMPGMAKMGVSKKIEDEAERTRLRKILDGLTPPKDCGFIIRTAGIGKSKVEIERDLKYLARLWDQLKKQIDKDKPPVELYTEGDLITRSVRDVFTSDVDSIIVDDKETAKKIKDFIKLALPRTKNKVELYEDVVPLFHKYELESVVEGMYSRRVPLPSGGSLIIDQTEAVVAIDVNSGKFRDHSDAETTAFKTDMEAADEIPRQLRLRDMGGVIICDFIDLRYERHRRELEERLFENLKQDRAKTRMLRMSQFGIIEMTRQRMRPSLRKAIYHDCHACAGQGMVKTPESMALDVMRKLRIALNDSAVLRSVLTVHPEVATYLQNKKRYELAKLEQVTEKTVAIVGDADLSTDETKFELYDSRDGYIYIAELGMALPSTHGQTRRDAPPSGPRRRDERRREPAKAKHDKRDDDSVDADEMFGEEGDAAKAAVPAVEAPAKAPKGRGRGKTPAIEADDVEMVGNDDEASVVDVEDGGDAMPGPAAGGFFDPSEQRHRERDRNRGRGRDRGRGGRPDNRGPDYRQADNRNAEARGDDRDADDRDADDRDADNGNRDVDDREADDRSPEDRAAGPADVNREHDRNRNDRGGRGNRGRDNRGRDTRGRDNRGPAPRGPDERVPADAPLDERPTSDPDQDEPAESDGGDVAAGRAGESQEGEGQGGNADGGPLGPDGQPLNREGGRRRRRRRGRRGRGRNPGEEGGPPQGDREAGEAGVDQPHAESGQNDRPQPDRPQGDRPPQNRPPQDRSPQGEVPQRDRQPRQQPQNRDGRGGQRGGRDQRGQSGDGRRGSSRADLSHLAREAAARDAAHDAPPDAPAYDAADDEHATPGNDINFVPKPREEPAGRGARGGRRPGRGGARRGPAPKRTPPIEGLPNDEELDREAAALEAALAKAREAEMTPPSDHVGHATPAPIKVPDVAPTGSTDRHLADDEPADGEEVKPPASYTDLDALPEYDDD